MKPRVRRIHTIRLAAERDITHERIATELGLSPLRVLVLCERHGIPVRRGLQPVRHPPMPPREDEPSPTPGRKPGEQDRLEVLRRMREGGGGYVFDSHGRARWQPAGDPRRPPLFSLYASETGEPLQNVDIPLASLGEAGAWTVSKAPVVPGVKGKSPSWGQKHPPAATLHRVGGDLSDELRRVHRVNKYAKPTGGRRRAAEARP